jgi:hypothetical protein
MLKATNFFKTATVEPANSIKAVTAVDVSEKPMVAQEIHWTYGATWGISRGLLALELGPPVNDRSAKSVLIDGWHHAVYAVVAGVVYDAIVIKKK